MDHQLYSLTLLQELSIDTLGPLPEDEFAKRYIVLVVDNFSKFVGLSTRQSYFWRYADLAMDLSEGTTGGID